jgi:hypothetical protein
MPLARGGSNMGSARQSRQPVRSLDNRVRTVGGFFFVNSKHGAQAARVIEGIA